MVLAAPPTVNRVSASRSSDRQSLTRREREVIPLIAEGLLNKDVAKRLGVSEGTVKVHLHNIFRKAGVNNRTALAVLFFDEARRSANAAASKASGAVAAADHLLNMPPARPYG